MPYVESVSSPLPVTDCAFEPCSTSTTVVLPAVRPRCASLSTHEMTFWASTVASSTSKSSEQFEQCSQRNGASVSPK